MTDGKHQSAWRRGIPVAAILVVALAIRLFAATWWQSRIPADQSFAFPDSQSYWALGRALAAGGPYEYPDADGRVFRSPGYPLCLAPVFLLLGPDAPVWSGRCVSILLGLATVVAVMALAGVLFGRRAAHIAGGLTAVYPAAVAMSVFVLSEAAFAPLMVGQLVCWTRALQLPDVRWRGLAWSLAAGICGGLATLARPSWLLFTPFAGALVLTFGHRRVAHAVRIGVVLAGMCLVLLPWWMRNYRVTGKLVLTTLQVGASLYDGWNPRATGASDMAFTRSFYRSQRDADTRSSEPLEGTFEWRLDRRLRSAAWGWACDHPHRAFELGKVKLLRMWSPWPNADEFRSWPMRLAILCSDVPLMALALVALWPETRRRLPEALVWLPAGYLTLLHMIFVSSIRYRQPALLPLLALAGGCLAAWTARPADAAAS